MHDMPGVHDEIVQDGPRISAMLDVDDCGRTMKPWLGSFDYDHPEGPQIACVYLPYFALPLCCWRHLHERHEGFPVRLAAVSEALTRGCTIVEVGDESLGHLYRWALEKVNRSYIPRESYRGEEIVGFPFAQAEARHREPCACRSYSTELQAIYDAVMAERGSVYTLRERNALEADVAWLSARLEEAAILPLKEGQG
jgi:hypothetical protein